MPRRRSPPPKPKPAPAFTPPPPERHIAEGSFFVGDDKVIHQVEGGQGVPVVYGGTPLKADGTMTGKRLAALIGLRDLARRVLQSQNEGWPEPHRNDARRKLNRAYDRFVAAYGPINKTTFCETADGTVIRRMPNLVKFREDPDAMLVMALEDYDEVTGKAAKAPILLRDVVGKSPPVTSVASAEEGLLVSLDRTGGIDLPYHRQLYGKPEEADHRRAGRPDLPRPGNRSTGRPPTPTSRAMSGTSSPPPRPPARPTPATPRPCGRCSPRTCCPATSTPVSVPRGYRQPTSRRSPPSCSASPHRPIPIGHLKKDAVWSVEAGHAAEASVAATAEYGTPRANGTWLLELALNMKTPVIYDTIQGGDREERVVNQEATLAAREKQKLIKEKFKSWVFAEPERTERLVRLYNDTYNNLRPRLFDGSHLDFPGMSQGITLRSAPEGRRLAGHEQRQHAAGPCRRGRQDLHHGRHRHEDEAGRAGQEADVSSCPTTCSSSSPASSCSSTPTPSCWSPTKDDLARDRRKLLTAKIASGEWDGIIVTHSSFERIGMSSDYQERFLREQIGEYDQLLRDHAGGEHAAQHHQDHREAEGPPRGAAERPARRGQEG